MCLEGWGLQIAQGYSGLLGFPQGERLPMVCARAEGSDKLSQAELQNAPYRSQVWEQASLVQAESHASVCKRQS